MRASRLVVHPYRATLNFTPSPLSAAVAGAFSALGLPLATRWLGSDADVGIGYVLAFLLVVVLPAHALVLGFRRAEAAPVRAVDKPLLIRICAWIAAAAAVSLVPMAFEA